MKSQLKNLAMAAAIMFVPLKSTNTVRTVKPVAKEFKGFEQLLEQNKQDTKKLQEVIYAPFLRLQKLEAEKKLNYIRMPKPTRSLDVSETKFVGHPEFLNMFLSGALKGKGEKFIEAQEKHGINASFLVGIANLESGNGFSDYARNRNNIAGMRNAKGYMRFDSIDQCIDRMAENLKRNYIDQGITTIEKINKKYAESNEWGDLVVERMNPMYNSSTVRVYDFTSGSKLAK